MREPFITSNNDR